MSINIKIQKKDLWLLAAIFVFLVGVGYVIAYTYSSPIPNPGHGGDNVFININGSNTDLQTAINNSDFAGCNITGTSYSRIIVHGHKGEEIIINVNGTVKSLQAAINDSSLVKAEAGTSPSNFGSAVHGETGDKILININGTEKTLQEAINNGSFKCQQSWACTPSEETCDWSGSTVTRYWAGNTRLSPPERVQFWWGGGLRIQHFCLNSPGGVCTAEQYAQGYDGTYCYKTGSFMQTVIFNGNNTFYCICREAGPC